VVDHGAIKRLRGGREPAGRAAVGIAWRGVAAGVIVGEHNPGAAMHRGIANDLLQRKGRARFVTLVARNMEATRLLIDVRYPDALAVGIRIRHAAGKELPCCGKAVEPQGELGTLISHEGEGKRVSA